jgi:hypothetical protein
MLSPDFTPARYQVLTTSRFDFPNTAVFKIPPQKHGRYFSRQDGIQHFWGSRVSHVDFNQDGTWGGPFEQIAPSLKLRRGNNTISFNVPACAGSGTTFARFRISEYGNLSVTGATDHSVDSGEVEDYAVTILPPLTTDGNFDSENVVSSTEPGPVASVAADIDRDGDMDVVSGFYGSSTVPWFENDDEENFTAHAISASADGIRSLVASDLDRDGDMDIVTALADSDPSHHRFEWYKNDGSGNFTVWSISPATAPGDVPSDPGPRSVFVANVDGDADLDVIVGMDSPTKVAWYKNNGSQVFTKHTILDSGMGEGNSVFGADVDRDGDMDVVSALRGGGLSWFENIGGLVFTQRQIPASSADLQGECLRYSLLRENVAERQFSVLKKLTSQKSELLLKPSVRTQSAFRSGCSSRRTGHNEMHRLLTNVMDAREFPALELIRESWFAATESIRNARIRERCVRICTSGSLHSTPHRRIALCTTNILLCAGCEENQATGANSLFRFLCS